MQGTATIQSITRIDSEDRYDLSVEKNENFFANGILVHNCRYGHDGLIKHRRSYFG